MHPVVDERKMGSATSDGGIVAWGMYYSNLAFGNVNRLHVSVPDSIPCCFHRVGTIYST